MTEYKMGVAKKILRRELELQKKYARKTSNALHVPGLLGPVGLGKTSIVYEAAKDLGYTNIVKLNCGEEADPSELMGLWRVDRVGSLEGYRDVRVDGEITRKQLTIEHTLWLLNKRAARACAVPCVLFFDDIDKAEGPIQNAFLQIIGERRIRDTSLHKETLIVAAGNRVVDDIYAKPISESLKTRINFFEITPDIDDFLEYGRLSEEIHPSVLGFLKRNPELLHQKKEGALRFPTPRTWREVSMHFFTYTDPNELLSTSPPLENWKEAVNRKCGVGVGEKFWAWQEILSKIDVQRILRYGDVVPTNQLEEFASVWAVIAEVQAKKTLPTARGLDQYMMQLSPEIRTAAWAQLPDKLRKWFAKECPKTSASINLSAVR